ncbi:RNase J family beta-CASP ribonuclease [Sneathiella sp. P13V-1]|uniref:ribonuclease J n=1 Tax=Sneathiella sp. P13V-1 TaxID=2697366 RepID=UPI00187B6AD5|nr:ribonuclease J [Sneathiella sp. P13V-1]MBE7637585.1 RNase J family beta-CASP ribonuclease [Sneathiella sp. P13V-1]
MEEGLYFLPLGGSGEIGMNLNLYQCDGKWLMIDCGISFSDDRAPGIDVIVPDPSWIAERKDDLLGLVITHAHEDHVGAVAHLWTQFECPVYASPFTAEILYGKLREKGLEELVELNTVSPGGNLTIGPFDLEFVDLTHSIPEMQALLISTKYGNVVHSGDWKLDARPVVGPESDLDRMAEITEKGVLALVCDSTNVFKKGDSGSEGDVQDSLDELLSTIKTGKVAVTTFASNIARVATIARIAEKNGRHVVLVGRSLHRMTQVAKNSGYLTDLPSFIDEAEAGYLPPEKTLYLCTGSQGEPRGAMSRIAKDEHPHVTLSEGDTVIFSSKVIPGNERTLYTLHNRLTDNGVNVITEMDEFVHVSGHPARDELSQMYDVVKPKISVPVHGEARHLEEHCDFALSKGVEKAISVRNGDLVRLAPGNAEIIDTVPSGRLAVDAGGLSSLESEFLADRRKFSFNGSASGMLIVDGAGRITEDPEVRLKGVVDVDNFPNLFKNLNEYIIAEHYALSKRERLDDDAVETQATQAVRRFFRKLCGRRPLTDVYVIRIEE